MKLRITSITTSEVGSLISGVTTKLEDRLCPTIDNQDYGGGIHQFALFFVSVDTDPLENEVYCRANNRISKYKDIATGKMVSFISVAIPVDPKCVLSMSHDMLYELFEQLLLDKLKSPPHEFPKRFDQQKLYEDIKVALAK